MSRRHQFGPFQAFPRAGYVLATALAFSHATSAADAADDSPICAGDVDRSGVVNVADLVAVINAWGEHAATIDVSVTNYEYRPRTVGARSGDTIRWTELLGFHTVTSGALCTPDGRFNAMINSARPQFEYTLQPSDVGVLEYFCIPHCSGQGMSGSIQVKPFPEDLTNDGVVNAADLLAVINTWGPCR